MPDRHTGTLRIKFTQVPLESVTKGSTEAITSAVPPILGQRQAAPTRQSRIALGRR
jgi:hypothetical protein